VPDDIAALALAVAHTAGLGYGAQDWIRDGDGRWWFVDLNSVSEEFDLESTDGPCEDPSTEGVQSCQNG